MKRWYYVLIGLILFSIVFTAPAAAKSMKDVVGTYSSVTVHSRLWVGALGTDTDSHYSQTITIGSNKRFTAWIDGESYKGKCKVKKNKLIIKESKALRKQFGNNAIKPWIRDWVLAEGSSVSNLKLTYSKFNVSKSKINSTGAIELRINISGTARGRVSGEGNVRTRYKYRVTVVFNGRD